MFTATVNRILDEQGRELSALAESEAIRQFIAAETRSALALPPSSVTATAHIQPHNLPIQLEAILGFALNNYGHFERVICFDGNKRPLFLAERNQGRREVGALTIHRKDFLPGLPQPDEKAWATRGMTVLNSPVTALSFGVSQVYTVPVYAERVAGSAWGALVGQLNIDSVLAEAAKPIETHDMKSIVIVLDRSGRVLYHPNDVLKHQPVESALPSFMPVARMMLANQSGTSRFSLANGEKYLTSFMPFPRIDAEIAVAHNESQALLAARRAGLVGILLSGGIGLVAAFILARQLQRQNRGLDRVTEAVTAIAKGELDRRIEVKSGDEARVIADNINIMTERLREQLAREAEARQFESFVRLSAMLTHDLKNAIEALSLTVSNMELHFDNERFRADTMKSLSLATEKLKAMVARISNPVTTLSGEHKRPAPTDLAALLRRVVAMICDPAHSKYQIEFKLSGPVYALADPERIEKVIENLVINALEAMGAGGKLTVEAGAAGPGKVFFSVGDTGPGIPSEVVEHRLFRPFATTKKNGVGLGLYTCREVVRANGGVIEVQSKEGIGTTFRVVLPSSTIEVRN
jgi:signal transduction histidine kinase